MHVYATGPQVVAWLFPATMGTVHAGSKYQAESVAGFLEVAASAPEPVLRDLAARVREAAAEAWPEPEAG